MYLTGVISIKFPRKSLKRVSLLSHIGQTKQQGQTEQQWGQIFTTKMNGVREPHLQAAACFTVHYVNRKLICKISQIKLTHFFYFITFKFFTDNWVGEGVKSNLLY